jgi:hypothetical protein
LLSGYKRNKVDKLNYELNPGLSLLTDWIISSGNTALSIDLLISYLEQMDRFDIVEIVQKGQGSCSCCIHDKMNSPYCFITVVNAVCKSCHQYSYFTHGFPESGFVNKFCGVMLLQNMN